MADKRIILVVDDEQSMRDFLESSLGNRFQVRTASNVEDALKILASETVDLVLSDVQMPGLGGMDLLLAIREQLDYQPVVVMMTAFGTIEGAVQATHRGALDYLTKPFGMDQLDHVLKRAFEFEQLKSENRSLRRNVAEVSQKHGLLGNHSTMEELREKISMIADSRGTVLLLGESGTGKEVVAKAIHMSGTRSKGPFIRINCAAIPETLLESELFGYERGAFTGAIRSRKGKFELANGGTLLLDEISEMPLAMQAKLLRVLQEREIMRLGAQYAVQSDVRVIATSNRNLKEEVKNRNFREDLYFRLNVIPITIAPLRHRKEDIPLLANHFCQNFCAENGKPLLPLSENALSSLVAMDWPGNVRQLQNVIERAVILSFGDSLDEQFLDLADEMNEPGQASGVNPDITLKDMERELILKKLKITRGNRTVAAQELGISVRTLRNKLNLYTDLGVEIPG
ncbi:MAG: sigma-54 dependent transcriptional regulator [Gemmatimonadales bacterium]|nr:sigma-54 dependent transcriptional regulator [Gemmatimonadales bacterium]